MIKDNDIHLPPPFMTIKAGMRDDPNNPDAWNCWNVLPTGDAREDYQQGAAFADMAIDRVLHTDNPSPLVMMISTIFAQIINGQITSGAMEKGAIDRIVKLAVERRAQLKGN